MTLKASLASIFIAWLVTTAQAEAYGTSQLATALLASEITRHVIDECNLKKIYGKNRIDFDPYEVAAKILPEIHKELWQKKKELVDEISAVVHQVRSFAKRAMIYDVYYALCIGKIDIQRAEGKILKYLNKKLNDTVANDDSIVFKLFGTHNDNERVQRDESRIRILEYLVNEERDAVVKKKNLSVIQEYKN